jgi:hypothetical protein
VHFRKQEVGCIENDFRACLLQVCRSHLLSNLNDAANGSKHFVVAASVQQLYDLVLVRQHYVFVKLCHFSQRYQIRCLQIEAKALKFDFEKT